MSYEEALAFWYGRINYEQRQPHPDDFKLEQMRALLRLVGNPHERLRVIHVAGSKGKGSTSAMLAAILCQAGYRTGLFTSPHLSRVEERIQVAGQPISRDELVALLGEVQAALASAPAPALSPTFFEVATTIGFLHFVRRRVEVAVLEVGLGGRLDSTNVCLPEVALITSISIDHTKQLGTTVASIAHEKAGIIKPHRAVISGVDVPDARAVIEAVAHEKHAPLRQLGLDFDCSYQPGILAAIQSLQDSSPCSPCYDRKPAVTVRTSGQAWPKMELNLLGKHQAGNAAVAVACVEELMRRGWQISERAVAAGLASVCWPARMEVVGTRPWVVLDCAHNVASALALVDTLLESFPACRRHLVFASSNDKDVTGILGILAPHFEDAYLTRYGNNPRSVPPEELVDIWTRVSTKGCFPFPTPLDAWRAVGSASSAEDMICITGSVFLAGEMRLLLANLE